MHKIHNRNRCRTGENFAAHPILDIPYPYSQSTSNSMFLLWKKLLGDDESYSMVADSLWHAGGSETSVSTEDILCSQRSYRRPAQTNWRKLGQEIFSNHDEAAMTASSSYCTESKIRWNNRIILIISVITRDYLSFRFLALERKFGNEAADCQQILKSTIIWDFDEAIHPPLHAVETFSYC